MSKIPRRLYLYWGRNKKLSYLRYLTVKSFVCLNPDWEVLVYYPKKSCLKESWSTDEQKDYSYEGKDYFDRLSSEVETKQFDFEKEFCINEDVPEVIKSDILRVCLLFSFGGVWSDFDILYFRSMEELSSFVSVYDSDTYVCSQGSYFSIGFLMGGRGSGLYRDIYYEAINTLFKSKEDGLDYQVVGNRIFKEMVNKEDKSISFLSPSVVYPIMYNEVENLFIEEKKKINLSNSIGVHWFGGNKLSSLIDNTLNESNIDSFPNVGIVKLIKEMRNVFS